MTTAQTVEDLIFLTMTLLIGERGVDWQYYVLDAPYWRKWAELNRN